MSLKVRVGTHIRGCSVNHRNRVGEQFDCRHMCVSPRSRVLSSSGHTSLKWPGEKWVIGRTRRNQVFRDYGGLYPVMCFLV